MNSAYGGVTASWYSANSIERNADSARAGPDIGQASRSAPACPDVVDSLIGEQRGRREGEIGKDHGVAREAAVAQRALALAGQHEHRLSADRFGRLQVPQTVADARHVGQVDVEPL